MERVSEVLQNDPHRQIVRIGNTVRRPTHAWSETIHALLRHLEEVGFPYSPRFHGVDEEGREVLTYLEGESGPDGWANVVDEGGLAAMARLLRDYHRAVAGFRPPVAAWAAFEGTPAAGELVCHGDFGPWNLVWHGTRPVGILDWDYAWPRPPLHDVAYALEYVAPFRDDAECLRALRYPGPPDRPRRIELFAAAYGLTDTAALADAVIDQQQEVLDRTLRLAAEGRQPQVAWQESGLLAEVADRIAWSRQNRALFG